MNQLIAISKKMKSFSLGAATGGVVAMLFSYSYFTLILAGLTGAVLVIGTMSSKTD